MAMSRAYSALLLAISVSALSACAADTANYPTLARRDAERIGPSPASSTEATPLPPMPSPEELGRANSTLEAARAAHQIFLAHKPRTEQLVAAARGAPIASENWSVATIALASLESSRSDVMLALGYVDDEYARYRVSGSDNQEISRIREQLIGWVGEEDGVLANLRGKMP